jgi:hypothetical protein
MASGCPMTPVVVSMFATNVAGNASAPGQSNKVLALAPVRPAASGQADPNAGLFKTPGAGQITVTAQGLADAIMGGFAEGKKYTVTIADAPADPAPAPATPQ